MIAVKDNLGPVDTSQAEALIEDLVGSTPPVESVAVAQTVLQATFGRVCARTGAAYASDLQRFAKFLAVKDPAEAVAILLNAGPGGAYCLVEAWKGELRASLAAATVNRCLATLRSCALTAYRAQKIGWSLRVKGLAARPYRDTAGPGAEAIRQMLDIAVGRRDPKGVRDRALLLLLVGLALRRAEVLDLDVEHIDLSRRVAWIQGKGCVDRLPMTLPLPAADAIAHWLTVRGEEAGPLFTNFRRAGDPQRLSGAGLYQVIREYGRKAGVRCTPHGLRHTAISMAALTCPNLLDLQKYSRHKDLATVRLYYDVAIDAAGEIGTKVLRGLDRRYGDSK